MPIILSKCTGVFAKSSGLLLEVFIKQYPVIRQDNMSFQIRDCCLMTGGQALLRIGTFNPLERLAFVDW